MATWNCNGSMRLDVGAFEDNFRDRDIVFFSETHQAPGQLMPLVVGYRWETAHRTVVRFEHGSRGSGGVALLFREELQPLLHIVRRDDHARYMWVRLRPDTGRFLYIAICYFPSNTSIYAATRGESPFSILDDDIWEFSRDGDIILLGDFNARTVNAQTVFYDTSDEMLRELDVSDLGLDRYSQDKEQTEYGRYLTDMTTTHGLAILNGLQRFLGASGFTCFPHRHGANTVDYVMAHPSFIPCIQDFIVGARPGGKIRSKLMYVLKDEPEVVMEEGTAGDTGRTAAQNGMRSSVYCLSPAGDTPSSARLFDAIVSGCIPVVVSDDLELPFEGLLDYRKIAIFAASSQAVQPGWLINHLRSISSKQVSRMQSQLVKLSKHFEYSHPAQPLGPEDLTWRMIAGKVPLIKLHIRRAQRVVEGSRNVCTCDCRHGNQTSLLL
ncbi:hypothetical protein L7F22_055398 [Adiantum nelumboides]|nr:hypothetical protein [Adiantum nelumboides]